MQKTLLNTLKPLGTKLILVLLMALSSVTNAQEVILNIAFDASQYDFGDKSILDEMKQELEAFVNNRTWTEDNFDPRERIKLDLSIAIQSEGSSQNTFSCKTAVQSTRPVFNAAYESTLLSYLDNRFNFTYQPGQILEYNDNTYTSEITSLLAFYVYIALGMDYNSFSPMGGQQYFLLAQQVMNNHPSPDAGFFSGWSSISNETNIRSRFIVDAINPQFDPVHQAIYDYHRLGLDVITQKRVQAQQTMLESLVSMQEVSDLNTNSIFIASFMIAKRSESVAVFSGATPEIKNKVVPLLRKLDPANSEKYQQILRN